MRIFIFLTLIFLAKASVSQTTDADSIITSVAVRNVITRYHQLTGTQSPLYNGVRHEGYRFDIKGDAYFETADWRNGSILYDGVLYKDIPMLYDEVGDKLVVQNLEKSAAINLISERVGNFYLSGHKFLFVKADPDLKTPGFYKIAYSGNVSLLIKREKYIQENVNQLAIDREFISNDQYYLRKENRHYLIKSMKNVYSIFGDKEKEIKLFMRENNLSFKTDPELTLTKITEYYDQLTTS